MQKINRKDNIFGDDIAFVEQYDFSEANMSEENRIKAITQVASICYQNPNALGSESLYNRLAAESKGLPSSSFEFVPVLLDATNEKHKEILALEYSNVKKFGELICDGKYLLTNYRALVYDFENNENAYSFDIRTIYNTEIECEIIKEHFKVFLYKVDFPTRSQMVRHRVNWQELSRRYVSGKRVPFEFYISEKLQNNPKVEALIKQSEELYFELLENGVKPQEARRIIPQAGYSQIWGAFQPSQLKNFYNLRLHKTAQHEIQQTAQAMYALMHTEN